MLCPRCKVHNLNNAQYCEICGEKLISSPENNPAPQPAVVLQSRYRIDRPVGGGSMGAVYRAWDLRLEKYWALKEMHALSSNDADRKDILDRFRQEARILSTLQHPSLPRVVDYFSEGGGHYLVMDFIEGEDLETWLDVRGKPGLPEDQVIAMAIQILGVLKYLHSQNPPLLYRDVKPSNIMRRHSDGALFLVDFGIAKTIQAPQQRAGTAIGTEGYSPPEQYEGRCDPRSDLYALGATMHHLLTGSAPRVPFHFDPVAGISTSLQQGISKVLQKKPEERYQSAADMEQYLLALKSAPAATAKIAAVPKPAAPPPPPSPPAPRTGKPAARPRWRKRVIVGIILFTAAILLITAAAHGVRKLLALKVPVSFQLTMPGKETPVPHNVSLDEKEVRKTIAECMKALEDRDLYRHMSYYADPMEIYYNKKNCPWQFVFQDKERAIRKYGTIRIILSRMRVEWPSANTARAVFDKEWDCRNGDTFNGKEKQRLLLKKAGGKWKITGEEELEVYWVNKSH